MKNETKVIIGISIATVAILVLGALVFSKNAVQEPVISGEPVAMETLVTPTSHKLGAEDSEVVLVEFADFECPACAYAHPMIKKVVEEYGDRITYVYRHFPLHFNSNLAINAAEAAGEQGKFWEMHDKLFEGQNEWGGTRDDKATKQLFTGYAAEIGLDMNLFDKAFSKGYDAIIAADKKDGEAAGVTGTPNFYLNGKKIEGGVPNEAGLRKLLDEAIKEAETAE